MNPIEEKEDETGEETIERWLATEYCFSEDRIDILINCLVGELVDGLSEARAKQMEDELMDVIAAIRVKYEYYTGKEAPS